MSKKRTFQSLVVDEVTGEILKSVTHYLNSSHEMFGMYRKTDGMDWIFSLSGNELKLLIMMSDISRFEDGSVSLSKQIRGSICAILKIGKRQLAVLLDGLNKKDAIFRVNNNDFIINPATFFKCGTSELKKRIIDYKNAKYNANNQVRPELPA